MKSRNLLNAGIRDKIAEWAWHEIDHQLALSFAESKNADCFQLIYSIMLATDIGYLDKATPDQNLVLKAVLNRFFEQQLPDGSWPRSRPLFHYPGVGNAYCYEYEMLAQLLQTSNLRDRLLQHLQDLSRAASALEDIAYPLSEDGLGWSSGHHPQFQGPESWSTASVYHFAYGLDRLVAEAIRKVVFDDLGAPYIPPTHPRTSFQDFAPDFLDCTVKHRGQDHSLKELLFGHFVEPIAREAHKVEAGASMPPETPTSAIFFGPPGTSKTAITGHIASYLRWPRLTVDPSYFVRNGMDRMQAQAETLFNMLAASERIGVLLDEFDEMVRDRAGSNEILSRFLTTSMLPKLAEVNRRRRIAFVVATNHIDKFDVAITRSGRFDLILPVMPPRLGEKLKKWPEVREKLEQIGLLSDGEVASRLGNLTYDEFRLLIPSLLRETDKYRMAQAIKGAVCTLEKRVEADKADTWLKVSADQAEERIRIPVTPFSEVGADANATPSPPAATAG